MEFDIYNIIGLFGVFLYILAYLLLTLQKVTADSLTYILLNMAGAGLVLVSLVVYPNLPSIITQIVWIVISIVDVYNSFKTKKQEK